MKYNIFMENIMKNFFWYIGLAVIGVIIICFVLYKKKNILNVCSFFLSAISLAYICEVVILFVFDAYQYRPNLFTNPVAEDIVGHLICNGLFWGGFILLVSVFSLRYYWILTISGFFMFIEFLFLRLDIYSQNWWKTYMTGIAVVIYMTISKKWFYKIFNQHSKLLRNLTFYLILWLILIGPSLVLLILGRQHYGIGLFDNYYLDNIYLSVPYHMVLSLILLIFLNLKSPYWKITPFVIVLVSNLILSSVSILTFYNGWNVFYLTQLQFLCLEFYILLEKHALKSGFQVH